MSPRLARNTAQSEPLMRHWFKHNGERSREDHRVFSKRGIARQTEDIVYALRFAPGRDLGPRVVPVAVQGDPGVRPERPEAPAHMASDFLAGRRPGGA